MLEILTPAAYAHTQRLGLRLAEGMRAAVERAGLPWHIHHLACRSGYTFRPTPVRNAAEARSFSDDLLTRLIRIWLANRGVWEAIVGAGPVALFPQPTRMSMPICPPGTNYWTLCRLAEFEFNSSLLQ